MPYVETAGFQPISAKLPGSGHGGDRAVQRSLRDAVANALDVDGKGRGIHGLAVAIRDKLSNAAPGTDAVPSVLETINRALDDATQKLAAQGVSQQEIDAGVARFRSKLAKEIGELAGTGTTDPAAPTATEKSAIAVREVLKERFSLNIETAEGDKVSIRFKSLSVTEAAAARVANTNGSSISAEANVISRGRFQVSVDGDLNEAERTAIGNLLDKVDDVANDFFGGDVQAAFTAAARVTLDSDALSAFDVRMSYSRSLTAVQTYASNAKVGGAAATKPALATTDPVKLPAQTESSAAPTPDVVESAAPVVQTVKPAESAPATDVKATSAAVAHDTAKSLSAIETITSFAKDVLERLDKDDESDAVKFSLRWKVEFLVKAFGSVALTPTEQKAADALGIALEGETPGL